jgi:hypothetical protein
MMANQSEHQNHQAGVSELIAACGQLPTVSGPPHSQENLSSNFGFNQATIIFNRGLVSHHLLARTVRYHQ